MLRGRSLCVFSLTVSFCSLQISLNINTVWVMNVGESKDRALLDRLLVHVHCVADWLGYFNHLHKALTSSSLAFQPVTVSVFVFVCLSVCLSVFGILSLIWVSAQPRFLQTWMVRC